MLIPKNVCVCIWNTAQNVSFLWSLARQSCLCFQWINPRYWSGSLMSTDEGSSAKWIIVDWSPQGLAAPVPAVYSSWVTATAPGTRGTRTGEQRSTDPCLERWSETHPESFWHTPMKTNTGAVLFLPKDITWSVCFSIAIVSYFCFKESWTNINFLSDRSPGEKQKTALLWHPVLSEGTFWCLQLMSLGSSQRSSIAVDLFCFLGWRGSRWGDRQAVPGHRVASRIPDWWHFVCLAACWAAPEIPHGCASSCLSCCPILLHSSCSVSAMNQHHVCDCWLGESAFYCFMCLFSLMVYLLCNYVPVHTKGKRH